MKKTDRRPVARRIRELVYTDEYTLEIFRYPLNTNGSHIKKMQRAKRTNYNNMKKKVEITLNTDDYETSQNEEGSSPILENEGKKDSTFEMNFNDHFRLPQISIEDAEPINFSIDLEILKNFQDSSSIGLIEGELMIDKNDIIDDSSKIDLNSLKLMSD